jgi:hypothetical protein
MDVVGGNQLDACFRRQLFYIGIYMLLVGQPMILYLKVKILPEYALSISAVFFAFL